MHISGIDQAIWLAGYLAEITLFSVLVAREEYKRYPIFLASIAFLIIEDPTIYCASKHGSSLLYYQTSALSAAIDSLLQLGVMFEIAYKVLKPARNSAPRGLLIALGTAVLLGVAITAAWTSKAQGSSGPLANVFSLIQQINFSFAFLRLSLFALIAGFSQMLGITWKSHVIRLAAGLAFYSAVSVVVQVTISHLPKGNHAMYNRDYYLLSYTQVIAYIGALVFWVWSFLQKDAPRREFTPQMERILVTISQTARRNRVSLSRGLGHK